ncbi:PTPA-CTERM sorting domain-containing protein [Alkalinema pantanalense CENA528]|uniref:hypothetical protein n=1 Tax=Alkalinema pantanalense TaxID=1620705 RepID=UPI003D6EEDD2
MTMLKKVAVGAAFAASITAASFGASAPAQAMDLAGKRLSFSGSAQLLNPNVAIGGTSTLQFVDAEVGSLSQIGTLGGNFSIQNLTLTKVATNEWSLLSPVTSWLSGGGLGSITFNLNTFDLAKVTYSTPVGIFTSFVANLSGQFKNLPQVIDSQDGTFSSQAQLAFTGDTYSASITAVPVPALLPGAVGVGLAALRKRKARALATA